MNTQVEMEKFFDYYEDANHVEARIEHMRMKIALKREQNNLNLNRNIFDIRCTLYSLNRFSRELRQHP